MYTSAHKESATLYYAIAIKDFIIKTLYVIHLIISIFT